MEQDKVRVIKISTDALYEFIFEKFIESQHIFLDVDPLTVADTFAIDWENRQFIFCAHKCKNDDGNFIPFPENIDLQKLMKNLPDTTDSMFSEGRYKEFSKDELEEISKKDLK